MRLRNRGRGPNQKLRDAPRRQLALELKKQGYTFDEVAAKLGLKYRSSAQKLVARALKDLWLPVGDEYRQIQQERIERSTRRGEETIERLDALIVKYLALAKRGNIEAAEVVIKAEAARMKANAGLLQSAERLSKLLGLDAPTKLEHSGAVDVSKCTDEELEQLASGSSKS